MPGRARPRERARAQHPTARERSRGHPFERQVVRPPARAPRRNEPTPRRRRVAQGRPTVFVLLLAVICALDVIGLVMVLSASSVHSLREYGSSWVLFERQAMWIGIGAVALCLCLRLPYKVWQKAARPLLLLCVGLLVLVLVPGFGISVGGSARWLGYGQLRMQPSELAKLGLLVFVAELLSRRADRVHEAKAALRPVVLVLGIVALLVMKQPDMGTTMVLACIGLTVLFVGGTPLLQMGLVTVVGGGLSFFAGAGQGYRRQRLLCFLHSNNDPSGYCYHLRQSLIGFGTGGITGVGLGASRAKWGFLPNAHTDFIYTIIGEELGLIGSLLIVGLFVALAVLGIRAASRAPDRFGMLLAAGITAWIVGQAFINIGAAIGILPITGVPLPLVSFGGSSVVITMAAAGILLNVARQGRA